MPSIPIGAVEFPRYLTFETKTGAFFEVYSGELKVGFSAGSSLGHSKLVTFVPVSPNVLQKYLNSQSLLEYTVLVAVTAMADDDDESNFFEVQKAEVALDFTPFPPGTLAGGATGNFWVLKLSAELGCHNGNIQRVGYKITILASREDIPQKITVIDPKFRP